MKLLAKKLFSKFSSRKLLIILVFVFIIIIFVTPIHLVQAECKPTEGSIILNIPIPGLPLVPVLGEGCTKYELKYNKDKPPLITQYIKALYKFFVGIAGILAVFMITFGGVQWLFSGGNATKISAAKESIVGAIIGLVLAVGSYTILQTINPQLVKLSLYVPKIELETKMGVWCKDVELGAGIEDKTFKKDQCREGVNCNDAPNNLETKCGAMYQVPGSKGGVCYGAAGCSDKNKCAQLFYDIDGLPDCVSPVYYCFSLWDEVADIHSLPKSQEGCDFIMNLFAYKTPYPCYWKERAGSAEVVEESILKAVDMINIFKIFGSMFSLSNKRNPFDDGCVYTSGFKR